MYLLDTDHITLVARGGPDGKRILERLAKVPSSDVRVTIISYEEQMRGWLAEIASARTVDQQRPIYARLERMLSYYCATPVLPFDERAVERFQNLWIGRPRVGTMDLKIAAIALANDATLLTRNLTDFDKISELHAQDWSS